VKYAIKFVTGNNLIKMRKSAILFILILQFSLACLSQRYLNKSKTEVLKMLRKYNTGSKETSINFYETDSSVTMSVNSPEVKPFIFTCLFNSSGKCREE